MKYPAGQWRGARGAGPAGGSLPEASPTEEGTFCPLCDLTFSLPWARKLSKGPLRTLDSPLPTLAHRGVEVLCGKGLASVRAAAGRGASLSLPDPQRVRPAPRVRTPRSPVPGLGLAVPPSERSGEKRGQDRVPGNPSPPPRPNPQPGQAGGGTDFAQRSRVRDQSAQEPGGAGGAAELAERPKPGEGGEGMTANPCALLPARAPVLGSRAGGRRVCVSGCPGDPRLPGSPWRAPALRPGPGDPLPQHRDPRAPPAHFAKARKRPSRRQRNSNLLHSRPLRPPQTLPGALPRPRRQRARTGRGREAGWASLLPYAGQLEAASPPGPVTSRGSRGVQGLSLFSDKQIHGEEGLACTISVPDYHFTEIYPEISG